MTPRLLEENEIDREADALESSMTAAEEREAKAQFASLWAPTGNAPDLSDGGMVNGARLRPTLNGRPVARGRAAARRVWMWNGTESTVPLAWNPDGTRNDGGRSYLLKRYCLCCTAGGFRGLRCPACVKSNCDRCRASTSQEPQILPNGKKVQGFLIQNFYLSKEEVPFPARFYGDIDCMFDFCPRRGGRGFKTEEDMRMHARSRHRTEYQVRQETLGAQRASELEDLRRQVAQLTEQALTRGPAVVPQRRVGRPAKNAALAKQEPITIR